MFSAIILAAGSALRMGGINKQLAELDGAPVFVRSALDFNASDMVEEIIIACPNGEAERFAQLARAHGVTKLKCVVAGGASRALSVQNALEAVSDSCGYIAIHDGARPLITTADIDRVLLDAQKYGAAIAAAPATDTVKTAEGGFVEATPDRSRLYYAQTPQAFSKQLYLDCLKLLGTQAEQLTDDSALVERCGGKVRLTEISACNMKITRPDDLAAAEAIYRNRKAAEI